jgi:hypothetical protein
VLGPDPPPGNFGEIYRFLTIFNDFRAFNRAGKSVSKIGIYALPPQKRNFIANLWEFIDFSPFLGRQNGWVSENDQKDWL